MAKEAPAPSMADGLESWVFLPDSGAPCAASAAYPDKEETSWRSWKEKAEMEATSVCPGHRKPMVKEEVTVFKGEEARVREKVAAPVVERQASFENEENCRTAAEQKAEQWKQRAEKSKQEAEKWRLTAERWRQTAGQWKQTAEKEERLRKEKEKAKLYMRMSVAICMVAVLVAFVVGKFAHEACETLDESDGRMIDVGYGVETHITRSLEMSSKNSTFWYSLGLLGGGKVSGRRYDEKRSFECAVTLDPQSSKAWTHLGLHGGGWVGELLPRYYSARECFETAVSIDTLQVNSAAWNNLGAHGGGCVPSLQAWPGQVCFKAQDCFERALQMNPYLSEAAYNLGVLDAKYPLYCHSEQRFLQALELNPKNAKAWNNLGVCGGGYIGHPMIHIYNRKACFLKALELNPKYSIARSNMDACGSRSTNSERGEGCEHDVGADSFRLDTTFMLALPP